MTHAPWHSRPSGGGTFTGAHPSYSPPEPPAPAPVNIGTQNEPNQVNVGYGGGQVDPGLAAAVLTQNNPNPKCTIF